MSTLPIESHLHTLSERLLQHPITLLQAPPGTGKTTLVPLHLMEQPWLADKTILMLEPRRVAARNAATYMAQLINQPVGQQVGYRMRLDHQVSSQTRVEVITEGMLTRKLQDDPGLEGVGCIIFDEFHERSLQADLGLALALDAQQIFNHDLRILLMSATLNLNALETALGQQVGLLSVEAENHPVETTYLGGKPTEHWVDDWARFISNHCHNSKDSVLCFLPGRGEIQRLQQQLMPLLPDNVSVYALHGSLSAKEQDRAIAPAAPGQRKLVLATDIAETSLTLDGINTVIDTGISRKPKFNPGTGMDALVTGVIPQDSAIQRAGRAGRQGPGHCYRFWSRDYQQQMQPELTPEILRTDLAPLLLELACWGSEVDDLYWLNPPPRAHLDQARELLQELGALDTDSQVTERGREMATLAIHPRLANMMLQARTLGLGQLATELAALLSEADIYRRQSQAPADLHLRLIEYCRRPAQYSSQQRLSQRWCRQLGISQQRATSDNKDAIGLLLSFAYPDRIARQRDNNPCQYLLRNGRGASLPPGDKLTESPWIVAAELNDIDSNSRIRLAASIDQAAIETHFGEQITEQERYQWNDAQTQVQALKQRYLGAITLNSQRIPEPDTAQIEACILTTLQNDNLRQLPWNQDTENLLARLQLAGTYLQVQNKPWPDFAFEHLKDNLSDWLSPYLSDMRKMSDLKRLDLHSILLNRLDWPQQQFLEQALPTRIKVPSGSQVKVNYLGENAPSLPVRMQEIYGWKETPNLLCGSCPLSIELLSPAQRPVQITRDIGGFWQRTYPEVSKELRGRYPKHYWPEDPANATPLQGTKKQLHRK